MQETIKLHRKTVGRPVLRESHCCIYGAPRRLSHTCCIKKKASHSLEPECARSNVKNSPVWTNPAWNIRSTGLKGKSSVEKSIYSRENAAVIRLLKQLRSDSGVTQVHLAESLGVTQSYVSKIERGERIVDIVQLRAICICLGSTLPKFVNLLEQQLQKSR